MKIIEMVEKLKEANPSLFEGKNRDKLAASILRNTFAVIREEIQKTESGVVRIGGLGRFRVKRVELTDKEGQSKTRRVTTFVAK
jgi:hypothetical protein